MKANKPAMFLDAVHSGLNAWWRYLVALFIILLFWLGIGSLPTLLLIGWIYFQRIATGSAAALATFDDLPMLPTFIATMLSFVFLLVGLYLAVRLVHNRKFKTLITPKAKISWLRVGQGFGFWFLLVLGVSLLESVLNPGRYQLDFQIGNWVLFAILGVLFIPIQTSAEELLFRGYLVQALGLKIRNTWVLSLASGILFGVLHLGNPEASSNIWLMTAYYVIFGIFLALITLWDGSLELVLGLHAANNLFSALFVTYPDAALRTPALFTVNFLDPLYNLLSLIGALLIFTALFFARKKGYQV